jgi:hypothetical protein
VNQINSQTPQRSTKSKIFVFTILSLLLVVFPAMSWFYLRQGLDWRLSVQAELRNYGKVRGAYFIAPGDNKINLIEKKVCVLHIFGENPELTDDNKKVMDIGEKLKEQFGQNDDFRLVMIAEGGTPEFRSHYQKIPGSEGPVWVWTGGLGSWRTILENGYESYCLAEKTTPAKTYLAVSDTAGTVRCYYDIHKKEEIDRMVTHISLLLPPK